MLPSIDDYLPIGEVSLPHALIWDSIKSSVFRGGAARCEGPYAAAPGKP